MKPVCPLCRKDAPLRIRSVAVQEQDTIREGLLVCSNAPCQCEYPILEGIPIIVAGVREFVSQNILPLVSRSDLSETTESVLGDCSGPGSSFDVQRQHLSTYGFAHYGDLDPLPAPGVSGPAGSTVALFKEAFKALPAERPRGPAIDLGCALGRTTFELGEALGDLVVGVDLNFHMLRAAARVQNAGVVRYPLRRSGLVYDRREFPARFPNSRHVDFWACDAAALPFAEATFALATSLNVLDCVRSPYEHLTGVGRVLRPGGAAVFTTPYDWSTGATPVEAWLGGHSQRTEDHGSSERLVRSLLNGTSPHAVKDLSLVSEAEAVPWSVRLHDRCAVNYLVHLLVARKPEA